MPEVHGCGQQARSQARQDFRVSHERHQPVSLVQCAIVVCNSSVLVQCSHSICCHRELNALHYFHYFWVFGSHPFTHVILIIMNVEYVSYFNILFTVRIYLGNILQKSATTCQKKLGAIKKSQVQRKLDQKLTEMKDSRKKDKK